MIKNELFVNEKLFESLINQKEVKIDKEIATKICYFLMNFPNFKKKKIYKVVFLKRKTYKMKKYKLF